LLSAVSPYGRAARGDPGSARSAGSRGALPGSREGRTVEDKIDRLIESKQKLSRDVLGAGAEQLLTEMRDDEILDLVALDLRAASAGE
jgi:hypothetical protein